MQKVIFLNNCPKKYKFKVYITTYILIFSKVKYIFILRRVLKGQLLGIQSMFPCKERVKLYVFHLWNDIRHACATHRTKGNGWCVGPGVYAFWWRWLTPTPTPTPSLRLHCYFAVPLPYSDFRTFSCLQLTLTNDYTKSKPVRLYNKMLIKL